MEIFSRNNVWEICARQPLTDKYRILKNLPVSAWVKQAVKK
ncbi:MAG: hypothetical protein ACXWW0_09835 [Bacteroidia bacterium]